MFPYLFPCVQAEFEQKRIFLDSFVMFLSDSGFGSLVSVCLSARAAVMQPSLERRTEHGATFYSEKPGPSGCVSLKQCQMARPVDVRCILM